MSSRITRVSRKPARKGRMPGMVECIIAAGALLLVLLIVVPTLAAHREANRLAQAKHDTHRAGKAMLAMLQDIDFHPYMVEITSSRKNYHDVTVFLGPGMTPRTPRRDADALRWTSGVTDLLNEQLIENSSAYEVRYETHTWRGPYLMTPLSADPWNNAYVMNIEMLSLEPGSRDKDGRPKRAVFVLSAGPNGIIDTPYEQPITKADLAGDDIGFRIQ